jgi:hypothetical protein
MRGSAATLIAGGLAAIATMLPPGAATGGAAQDGSAPASQRPAPADVVWCPMHPDVRSPLPGKCPICAMDLVPIPAPRIGEYRLDVSHTTRGARHRLAVRVIDPQSGAPVLAFNEVHERLLHLFIISRDLQTFLHEHPRRTATGFEIDLDLRPGAYMLIADLLPEAGTPQLIHHAIVTPGVRGSPFAPVSNLRSDLSPKRAGDLRIEANVAEAIAGREALVRFSIRHAKTGAPITDLEPFLGASGHLLVVTPDLTQAVHAHPEGALTSGPEIGFSVLFPSAGVFKMWVQVQRAGTVLTAPFVVRVDS